jgi:hypothetical protein
MKTLSLVAIGITSAIFSFAQTPKFGFKAGANISNIKWGNNTTGDSRIGLHAGGLMHIHLTPQWALQPEVYYSAEGGKVNSSVFPEFSANEEVTWKNDYVNIPLLLQYNFDNGFRLQAGPQLGLLVSSKVEDQDGIEDDADEVFKSTNVGLGFGLGYLSYSGLGIDARYNLGLSRITEPAYQEAKGRVFQIGLFYLLDNDHKAKSR